MLWEILWLFCFLGFVVIIVVYCLEEFFYNFEIEWRFKVYVVVEKFFDVGYFVIVLFFKYYVGNVVLKCCYSFFLWDGNVIFSWLEVREYVCDVKGFLVVICFYFWRRGWVGIWVGICIWVWVSGYYFFVGFFLIWNGCFGWRFVLWFMIFYFVVVRIILK